MLGQPHAIAVHGGWITARCLHEQHTLSGAGLTICCVPKELQLYVSVLAVIFIVCSAGCSSPSCPSP